MSEQRVFTCIYSEFLTNMDHFVGAIYLTLNLFINIEFSHQTHYIEQMNNRLIHFVVLLLLLSLTAHEVHATVSHDTEACEVCIHVQSNDDALPADQPHYLLLDVAFHVKIQSSTQTFHSDTSNAADLIRGPPKFS